MMKSYSAFRSIVFAATMLGVSSGGALAEECKNPDALRFSMIPTEEISQEVEVYKPLIAYLEKTTGKQVEFFLPTSYASIIEGMLGGWVDVSMLGPSAYVIANERDPNIQVFASYTNKASHFQTEGLGYKAMLLMRSDSEYQSIEDLKGAVIGLVDPASTSGNLVPRVSFTKEIDNAELEDYFERVVYTGGHDLSAVAIKEGKVDAAFVATLALDSTIDRGVVTKEDFRIIWSSETVPQVPFTLMDTLCPELKDSIRAAFLTLHEDEGGRKFLSDLNSTKFISMEDEDYDIIRALKASKK